MEDRLTLSERRELKEVTPIKLQLIYRFLRLVRSANLYITLTHSVILKQELYQYLKEIFLNIHIQAILDLFSQNLQGTA